MTNWAMREILRSKLRAHGRTLSTYASNLSVPLPVRRAMYDMRRATRTRKIRKEDASVASARMRAELTTTSLAIVARASRQQWRTRSGFADPSERAINSPRRQICRLQGTSTRLRDSPWTYRVRRSRLSVIRASFSQVIPRTNAQRPHIDRHVRFSRSEPL